MERSRSIKIILFLAVVLVTSAALAKSASVLLQEGLYAEEIDGDLDAAIKIYEQIIADSSAQRSHVAQAMYLQGMCYLKKQDETQAQMVFGKLVADYSDQTKVVNKVKPMLEELSNGDPAALMPPDTLIYIEVGSPGKQVETILKMLKGTPFENPLAAIGGGKGNNQGGPDNIIAGLLNPSMMAEFKKIRGIGIGVTGIAIDKPPVIVVLYPGKSDALRGLVMAALAVAGRAGETIEGMQTVAFPHGGGAAYDDTVVIIASPTAYSAGQLTWCVKQHKGLITKPTLASSNKSFAKVARKDRQENAFTVWANVDEVFAGLKQVLPAGDMPEQIRKINELVDLERVDDLIAFLSIEEDGIAVEANVGFKDGHRSVAYDMIRTPNLSKAGFEAVPSEAIALVSVALGDAESAQARMLGEKIKEETGLEIAGDVFENIDQITLFALPPGRGSSEAIPGVPPIFTSIGLAITSDDPQQTRQILTGLLTAANLVASQSADEQNSGRYQIELVNMLKLHCFVDQANKAAVLSLNPSVLDVSASAIKNSKSVATAGPLNNAVGKLSPTTSKLALVNVGGAIRVGGAYFLLGMTDSKSNELLAQLAQSCDKTTFQFQTYEEANNFKMRAELSELPPISQVLGPITQLSRLRSEAKAQARQETRRATISASVRKASRPPAIDGKADDLWSESRRYKIGNVIYSPASSDEDFSASYKAMWDEKNLYVLVNVTDDSLKNDSDEFWLDDGVEVFIDADNSKSGGYDDNDYQYFFEWAEANPGMGEFKHGRTTGVEFAIERVEVGYRVEIKLPWSTLGVEPSAGKKIGLDVHVNDDDDGGDRDTKLTWRGKEDNAWQTPSVFGTAELAGLIGWWKFDGNANDSSGNANHGTENGDPTYVAGKIGRAISFDGEGDRIEVPATVTGNPELFPATAISASAWVRSTVPASALCSLIRHEFHFTPLQTFADSAWASAFTDQDGSRALHSTRFDWSKINDGKWHHCVITYNNGIHEVWIDGTKEVSDNFGPFPLWTGDDQPWVFGGREHVEGKDDEDYPGELDDVRIYNFALSDGEITELYDEGK